MPRHLWTVYDAVGSAAGERIVAFFRPGKS
jgi:hypothetical protein